METIKIYYKSISHFINISREKAFPNFLIKIEFDNSELLKVIKSPIWIEEKKDIYSFKHINCDNLEQKELLNSIFFGINEHYCKEI